MLNVIPDSVYKIDAELSKQLDLLTSMILGDFQKSDLDVNLKLISSEEMQNLNHSFRKKDADTNVLSFPADEVTHSNINELGDIAISIPFIKKEAKDLSTSFDSHIMHMLAHGILHLLGHDHLQDKEATLMESTEANYLKKFNIASPY